MVSFSLPKTPRAPIGSHSFFDLNRSLSISSRSNMLSIIVLSNTDHGNIEDIKESVTQRRSEFIRSTMVAVMGGLQCSTKENVLVAPSGEGATVVDDDIWRRI